MRAEGGNAVLGVAIGNARTDGIVPADDDLLPPPECRSQRKQVALAAPYVVPVPRCTLRPK